MKRLTKQSRITFVELPATQFGVLNGDMGFDVYSAFKLPSRAIPTLRGVLIAEGYTNTHELNPKYNGYNGRLTSQNMRDVFSSDVLCVSSITRTSPQSMKLAELYKMNNPEGVVIAGGPDPTFRAEDWLRYVDVVVKGEGERTLKDLMARLTEDPSNLADISGIAYNQKGNIEKIPKRSLLTEEELGQLPHPFYDPEISRKISTGTIETTRGCPHDCDFCGVTSMYGNAYRRRPVQWTLEEMLRVNKIGTKTMIVDDNVAPGGPRDMERLEAIASLDGRRIPRIAQVTVYASRNERLLEMMKRAGIEYLCVGIESLSDETLKALGKSSDSELNRWAIPRFRKAGFYVHGMMMIGGEGDTPESLRETSEWANHNLDSVQFFVTGPIPGTRFYKQMEEQGRILSKDWSLYDGQHVLVRPSNLSPIELHMKVEEMYRSFYSLRNLKNRLKGSAKKGHVIVLSPIFLPGLIDKIFDNPQTLAHKEFLRSVS